MAKLLQVKNLSVDFNTPAGTVHAVRNISFTIDKGETVALVGESGSGKSVSALSLMQLLPYPVADHPAGSSIKLNGEELIGAPQATLRGIRGNQVAIIFQEPMTSLNPLHTIERQVNEVLFVHKKLAKDAARVRTLELLKLVGLKSAESRLPRFSTRYSRALIALLTDAATLYHMWALT